MHRVPRALLTQQRVFSIQRRFNHTPQPQNLSADPSPKDPSEFKTILSKPSWSVKSLLPSTSKTSSGPSNITNKQLYHLLRLSALPLPSSEAEETAMVEDLESQLHFVRAIQDVNTEGVEPLRAIKDETRVAESEGEIGLEELRAEFEEEEVVGRRGRIRRRRAAGIDAGEKGVKKAMDGWDLLGQAPKKMGRFVVVETDKD